MIAVPRKKGPLVLDMALGQFSYSKMEDFIRTHALLPYNAGFDDSGNLTKDPATILANELALPVGLWKGAGLALILDVLVSILSEGNATHQIGVFEEEYAISQFFFALYIQKMGIPEYPEEQIDEIIESLKS